MDYQKALMTYLPFLVFLLLIIASYFYDIYGNGINKISYDKEDDKGYTAMIFIFNILYGMLIFYTCYIDYKIIPWVLTLLTFVSFISIIAMNLAKKKIE